MNWCSKKRFLFHFRFVYSGDCAKLCKVRFPVVVSEIDYIAHRKMSLFPMV